MYNIISKNIKFENKVFGALLVEKELEFKGNRKSVLIYRVVNRLLVPAKTSESGLPKSMHRKLVKEFRKNYVERKLPKILLGCKIIEVM